MHHTIIIHRPGTFGFNVKWSLEANPNPDEKDDVFYSVSCPRFGCKFSVNDPDPFDEFRKVLMEEWNLSFDATQTVYSEIISGRERVITVDGLTGNIV